MGRILQSALFGTDAGKSKASFGRDLFSGRIGRFGNDTSGLPSKAKWCGDATIPDSLNTIDILEYVSTIAWHRPGFLCRLDVGDRAVNCAAGDCLGRLDDYGDILVCISANTRSARRGLTVKCIKAGLHRGKFQVLIQTQAAEAAMMTLKPGEASDEDITNEHPRCEQWVYVISGSGKATSAKPDRRTRTVSLREGMVVVIEKDERHQIRNSGRKFLKTLNIYVPPAYTGEGEVRSSAKR